MCKGGGLELDYVYSPNADRLLYYTGLNTSFEHFPADHKCY